LGIRRLNHAVLYVSDVNRSVEFYRDVLGFRIKHRGPAMAFLRAAGPAIGLYHLAWSVNTLAELAEFEQKLTAVGALVGSSDHVVSKSLYGKDPDNIEFEVSWFVPRDRVTQEMEEALAINRLDIASEIERWGASLVGAL